VKGVGRGGYLLILFPLLDRKIFRERDVSMLNRRGSTESLDYKSLNVTGFSSPAVFKLVMSCQRRDVFRSTFSPFPNYKLLRLTSFSAPKLQTTTPDPVFGPLLIVVLIRFLVFLSPKKL